MDANFYSIRGGKKDVKSIVLAIEVESLFRRWRHSGGQGRRRQETRVLEGVVEVVADLVGLLVLIVVVGIDVPNVE